MSQHMSYFARASDDEEGSICRLYSSPMWSDRQRCVDHLERLPAPVRRLRAWEARLLPTMRQSHVAGDAIELAETAVAKAIRVDGAMLTATAAAASPLAGAARGAPPPS